MSVEEGFEIEVFKDRVFGNIWWAKMLLFLFAEL